MSFAYLGAPYSHALAAMRALRFAQINEYAGRLMVEGIPVFSPISQSHPVARYMRADKVMDHDFWMRMDLPILEKAACLVVLQLDGWQRSRGLTAEVQHAEEHCIPIVLCRYDAPPPVWRVRGFLSEIATV